MSDMRCMCGNMKDDPARDWDCPIHGMSPPPMPRSYPTGNQSIDAQLNMRSTAVENIAGTDEHDCMDSWDWKAQRCTICGKTAADL